MASVGQPCSRGRAQLACLIGALLLLWASSAFGASQRSVVYYDPDGNHQAILTITTRLNAYLKIRDLNLVFQPVQSQEAFAAAMAQDTATFAIVSALALRSKLGKSLKLKPLLVPQADGGVHYQKVLVTLSEGPLKSLDGTTTAVALIDKDPRRAGRDVLRLLERDDLVLGKPVVVPVSKDIDALLALSFRQVEAALVTPKSVKVVQRINPSLARSLQTKRRTRKLLRSPLCVVAGRSSADDILRVELAFQEMSQSKLGRAALDMLGFQQWVRFRARMWK